jgi:large subunit ribosomal protein L3
MTSTFFARKSGMTGKFDDKGNRVGVTILEILPMTVKDLRTKEKNGYNAARFTIKDLRFKKERTKEVRTGEVLEAGQEVKIEEILKPGDVVKVTGISKGKGFAGVVKRHHFKGGPRTHGQSNRERAPGSSGSTTTPGRVFPGTRRAGHMGNVKVSVSGLRVLEVDPEKRQVAVIGSVPGMGRSKGQLVTVTKQS